MLVYAIYYAGETDPYAITPDKHMMEKFIDQRLDVFTVKSKQMDLSSIDNDMVITVITINRNTVFLDSTIELYITKSEYAQIYKIVRDIRRYTRFISIQLEDILLQEYSHALQLLKYRNIVLKGNINIISVDELTKMIDIVRGGSYDAFRVII